MLSKIPTQAAQPYKSGYLKDDTYIYQTQSTIDIEGYATINTRVYYESVGNGWVHLATGGYIREDDIQDKKNKDIIISTYTIPEYDGKKTWMPFKIFGEGSDQYALQQIASTDENGLRIVKGRYCVAVGSAFNTSIGQYFDLKLSNGTVIPCVMGDQKADADTDINNIFTANGCCSEFIVDTSTLNSSAKTSGSVSSITTKWDSPVEEIIVYDKNALE